MGNRMTVLAFLMIGVILAFAAFEGRAEKTSGQLEPKTENFIIILDASASFNDEYGGTVKLDLAKDVITRINDAIPSIPLRGELRTFGKGNPAITEYLTGKIGEPIPSSIKTEIVYGPAQYSKDDFGVAVERVGKASGLSHLDAAIGESSRDMESFRGRTAIIVVSDGKLPDRRAYIAADRMKQRFGENVCIHSVFIPSDTADIEQVARDKRSLEEIVQVGGCGFSVTMDDIVSDAESFTTKVFLGPVSETVTVKTKPEETPKPFFTETEPSDKYVDTIGKSSSSSTAPNSLETSAVYADADGDGVSDDKDRCPDTPAGVKVNPVGCWVLGDVLFDTGKTTIRPEAYPELDNVVSVLSKDKTLKVEIQGHTDSFGSPKFNMNLSEKRAKAVMDYIVKKGIEASRMTSRGYGREKPAATNNTPEGREMNRRVELKPI